MKSLHYLIAALERPASGKPSIPCRIVNNPGCVKKISGSRQGNRILNCPSSLRLTPESRARAVDERGTATVLASARSRFPGNDGPRAGMTGAMKPRMRWPWEAERRRPWPLRCRRWGSQSHLSRRVATSSAPTIQPASTRRSSCMSSKPPPLIITVRKRMVEIGERQGLD